MNHQFLPVSKEDLKQRGIDRLDFVYITGDAYVDHPSFGPSIIGRLLESRGYTVGIMAQPDWKDRESITVLGETAAWFSCIRRKYGFDGKPLFCFQKAPADGFLHTGRCDGKTAGLCGGGVYAT